MNAVEKSKAGEGAIKSLEELRFVSSMSEGLSEQVILKRGWMKWGRGRACFGEELQEQRPWDRSMLGIFKDSKEISVASHESVSEVAEEDGKLT